MNVLNIHGYKGTQHNMAYNVLCSLEKPIISPAIDYDNEHPEDILQRLLELCVSEEIQSLVGTDLGGFFALIIAVKLEKPVILVNPCLQPETILPELGYLGDITAFAKMSSVLEHINQEAVRCIVGEKDESIGSNDFTKKLIGKMNVNVVPNGTHNAQSLKLEYYFPNMLKYHYIYNLNMKRKFAKPKRIFKINGDCFERCGELWEDPNITEYIIPDGIKKIGRYAFYQYIYVEEITLPEGLVEIGDSAFERCAELRKINIPSSVKKIGKHVFCNCPKLDRDKVKFPKDVQICGDPFETSEEEWHELDQILYDQRDNLISHY